MYLQVYQEIQKDQHESVEELVSTDSQRPSLPAYT